MKRFILIGLSAVAGFLAVAWAFGQQPGPAPGPIFQIPAAPPLAPGQRYPTGARSSRKSWEAHRATRLAQFDHQAGPAPAQFAPAVILTPAQMSYWGNDTYGDCVSAEEWWAKAVYPIWYDKTKTPLVMSSQSCVQWAFTHGYLFGADLTSVMDSMASSGPNWNGTTYTDGPYVSVDYTNRATLCSAIFQGPVKLGCAAGPLQNVVNGSNGWFLVNAGKDTNYDHCIGMWGYGTISYLASALGVQVPAGTDGTKFGYGLFTWDTMGIADEPSFLNIVEEAWLRNPTTPQTPPGPPTPTPTPGGLVWALVNPPAGASIDQSGNFTWPIPATQPNEYMTITFTVASGTGAPTTGQFQITVSAAVPGSVTIAPIPGQSAASGSTFTLNLNQYVTVNKGSPAPGKQLPVPPLPAHNP